MPTADAEALPPPPKGILGNTPSLPTWRNDKGQFGPGNPGKQLGTRNRITLAIEAMLESDAEHLVSALILAARRGDPTALRLAMERVAPLRRGREIHIPDMPALENAQDVPRALAHIAKAVAAGELTAEDALSLATLIEKFVGALDVATLGQRLTELEQRLTEAESFKAKHGPR